MIETTETVILEKINIAAQQMISKRQVEGMSESELKRCIDTVYGDVVMTLESYVWGMPGEVQTRTATWPKTWWDHLKQSLRKRHRMFNRLLKVNWETETFEFKPYRTICPHHHTATRDKHLRFMTHPWQVDGDLGLAGDFDDKGSIGNWKRQLPNEDPQ